MTIGDAGTGSLTISDGGALVLKGDALNLGKSAGGKGTLQLSGAESSITFPSVATFKIGDAGSGELDLNQGFTLDTGGAAIDLGAAAGSTGKAIVTNADTSWTMGTQLTVGDAGTGTLTVSDGGSVTFKWPRSSTSASRRAASASLCWRTTARRSRSPRVRRWASGSAVEATSRSKTGSRSTAGRRRSRSGP